MSCQAFAPKSSQKQGTNHARKGDDRAHGKINAPGNDDDGSTNGKDSQEHAFPQ